MEFAAPSHLYASCGIGGGVTIPTTSGSYISTDEATLTNCNSENSGKDIGSTHNGSTMTMSLNNTAASDYILQFLSGANGLTATIDVNVKGGGFDQTQSFNISNTGSWTPSVVHAMELKNLPAGNLTLKLTVTSTTGSYAGNYGSFAVYPKSQYDEIPGNITLDKGAYQTARVEGGGNVGYCSNGATATYTVYNTVKGTATLNMGMVRYGDGNVTVTVTDLLTGTVEQTKQFTTTSDICKGYDTPTAIELGTLTKGLKAIKLAFAISSGFICNYKNVSVSIVPDAPDPVGESYTFGTTRDAAGGEVTSNNYMLTPDCSDVTTSSLLSTYGTLGTGYNFYNGTSVQLTFGANATQSFRNSANSATIKTQAGTDDGAENHGAYVGFDLTIEKGKQLQITNIASLIYPGEKSNYGYEYIIEDANGNQLYKSNTFNVAKPTENSGSKNVDVSTVNALKGLTGKVRVKFLWWCNSSSTVLILKDFNVTATVSDAPAVYYNVNYSLGTSGATGNVPAAISDASTLSKYTVPANTTIYKEGYTLTGWTDGENEYLIGQSYDMEEKTYNLTPVFTANTVALSEVRKDLVVTWKFGKGNGAPAFDGSAQNYVQQVSLNGNTTDLAVQMAGGDNSGRNDEWMNNQQKNMTVPVCEGAVVRAKVYYANNAVFNNETLEYSEALNGPVGNVVYTYTCPAGVGSTIDVNVGNQFLSYIEVTYPGTNVVVFEDFAVNFKVNPYVVTIPSNGELPECVTISGSYHNDHGYTGAVATVKVDGPVKITVGGCNFTGTATVKDGANLVATLDTKKAGCSGVAVAYYNGPKTTLTINCGTYCPSLKVEAVNAEDVPTLSGDGMYHVTANNANSFNNVLEYANSLATAEVPAVIYVPNGTYDLGTACRTQVHSNVAILGESRENVMIINHPTGPGIQATSTLRITGDDVYLQNLTLRCDVSYSTSQTHGVGVALEINGTRSICNNVELQCNQDTYYSNGANDQVGYFKGGRIEGTVDYICGGGNMWFEGTTLYNNQRYDGTQKKFTDAGDVIAAPSTAVATVYGYVMNNCIIDGADCQANNYSLARGWQGSPAMTWINTTCIKKPSTQGYTTMSDGLKVRFHELSTVDANGDAITGHSLTSPKNLGYSNESDMIYLENAANYTYANVLGGWDPEAIISSYNPIAINTTVVGGATKAFATYCGSTNFKANAGTIYKAAVGDGVVNLTCVNETGDEIIPAGEGVIISTDGSTTVGINYTGFAATADMSDNELEGTTSRIETPENCMALNSTAGEFQKYTGAYFPANKAYLVYSSPAPMRVIFDGTATAIMSVENSPKTSMMYNLAGQRVNANAKGIVIVNGKKILNN